MDTLRAQLPSEYPSRPEAQLKIKILLSNPQYGLDPEALCHPYPYFHFVSSLPHPPQIDKKSWLSNMKNTIERNSFTLVQLLLFRMESASYFQKLSKELSVETSLIKGPVVITSLATLAHRYRENFIVPNCIRREITIEDFFSDLVTYSSFENFLAEWTPWIQSYRRCKRIPDLRLTCRQVLTQVKTTCLIQACSTGRHEFFDFLLREPGTILKEGLHIILNVCLRKSQLVLAQRVYSILLQHGIVDDLVMLDLLSNYVSHYPENAMDDNLEILDWLIDIQRISSNENDHDMIRKAYKKQNFEVFCFLKRKLFEDSFRRIKLEECKATTYPMIWISIEYFQCQINRDSEKTLYFLKKFATDVACCAYRQGYMDLYQKVRHYIEIKDEEILRCALLKNDLVMVTDLITSGVGIGDIYYCIYEDIKHLVANNYDEASEIYLSLVLQEGIHLKYELLMKNAASAGGIKFVEKCINQGVVSYVEAAYAAYTAEQKEVVLYLMGRPGFNLQLFQDQITREPNLLLSFLLPTYVPPIEHLTLEAACHITSPDKKILRYIISHGDLGVIKHALSKACLDQWDLQSLAYTALKMRMYLVFEFLLRELVKREPILMVYCKIFRRCICEDDLGCVLYFREVCGPAVWALYLELFRESICSNSKSVGVVKYLIENSDCRIDNGARARLGLFGSVDVHGTIPTPGGHGYISPNLDPATISNDYNMIKLVLVSKIPILYKVFRKTHGMISDRELRQTPFVAVMCSIIGRGMGYQASMENRDRFLRDSGYLEGRDVKPEHVLSMDLGFLKQETRSLMERVCKKIQSKGISHDNEDIIHIFENSKILSPWLVKIAMLYRLRVLEIFFSDDPLLERGLSMLKLDRGLVIMRCHPWMGFVTRYIWHWVSLTRKD